MDTVDKQSFRDPAEHTNNYNPVMFHKDQTTPTLPGLQEERCHSFA